MSLKRPDGELTPLHDVADHIEANEIDWHAYYDLEAPEETPFPGAFNDNLTSFERLCLLRYDSPPATGRPSPQDGCVPWRRCIGHMRRPSGLSPALPAAKRSPPGLCVQVCAHGPRDDRHHAVRD